jgi:hypothetical protein
MVGATSPGMLVRRSVLQVDAGRLLVGWGGPAAKESALDLAADLVPRRGPAHSAPAPDASPRRW